MFTWQRSHLHEERSVSQNSYSHSTCLHKKETIGNTFTHPNDRDVICIDYIILQHDLKENLQYYHKIENNPDNTSDHYLVLIELDIDKFTHGLTDP